MLKILALASALLCAASINAEARPRHPVHSACIETGSVMRPACDGRDNNPFSGARSIKVTMHRERHAANPQPRPGRETVSYGVPSPAFEYTIGRPSRYIAGHLICAVNVGAALAERGIKGTGSALALSYLRWGRSAGGPVPGAVIVSARRGGGHVAIVSRVENGVVYAWNATGGQRGWREVAYRHPVLDYRVPG